jgi:hypothetical protein
MRNIREFFPGVSDERRTQVKADVILRILSVFQPRQQGPLTLEKLTGGKVK